MIEIRDRDYRKINLKTWKYPAGEIGYELDLDNRWKGALAFVKITCWFESSDELLLLRMLQDHLDDELGCHVEIIFPYLPASREDRRVTKNHSFGLDTICGLYKHITSFDVHNMNTATHNVKNKDPIKQITQAIVDCKPGGLIAPDKGAAERYNFPYTAFGVKQRDVDGNITKYELNTINIKQEKLLIIDDICDGGRTFIELAKLLPGKELYLYVSHGIFSKGFEELKKYYKHIYTTDSYKGERDNEFVTEYGCL